MCTYRTYRAVSDIARAEELAATTSPFTIEVQFLGGLTTAQERAFELAADRWARVIVGDLPTVVLGGDIIDDILIQAQGVDIDGTGRILGQAGPTHLRSASATSGALLPVKGIMSFDTSDLSRMEDDGTLNDVITHEMGHVLGIGTLWEDKGLLKDPRTTNPNFVGAAAMEENAQLLGDGAAVPVPVENTGGPGTADGHWRESVFHNELMSGFISSSGNPVSRMTVASLQDLGYQVDLDAAEPFELPDLLELARSGELVSHTAPVDRGMVLPVIPIVLPADSR